MAGQSPSPGPAAAAATADTAATPETAATAEFADIIDLGYEQARDQLVEIVARLEGGQAPLEESMRLWRRGEALAAHCTTWLDGAQAQLTADDAASSG